jgi:glutamate-ammonia-ligase adenylyltransferase
MRSDQPAPTDTPLLLPELLATAGHSRFVQRVRRRYAAELALLAPGLPMHAAIGALIDTLLAGGRPLGAALRAARQVVLERLAVLDVEQGCAMEDVTLAMSELAEATLDLALAQAIAEQSVRHGLPRTEAGGDIEFWVVGMGKLGARELNVSSDIDLVYVYEDDGQTDGSAPISAHEFFSQVARGALRADR